MKTKHLRQQQATLPSIEHDRLSRGESLPPPLMPTLPVTHAALPAMSSMAYHPQAEHAEPPREGEDAHGLELFDPANTPSAFLSGQCAQTVNNADISVQHEQFRLAPPVLVGTQIF